MTPMKLHQTTIIRVAYRELKSFGNFNNAAVEAVAEVGPGQSPQAVLDEIKGWVRQELLGHEEADRLMTEVSRMRLEVARLEAKAKDLRTAIKMVVDQSEIPF